MQGRTDGQTFVASSRLNIGLPKWCLLKQLAVGNTVQGAPACHRQFIHGYALVKSIQQMKEDFFKSVLQRISQVHIALRNFSVWLTRLSELLFHSIGEVTSQPYRSVR